MNKQALIDAVAESTGETKALVARILSATGDTIRDTLKAGESLSIPGVVKIDVKTKPAHEGRNPHTGEAIAIPEKRVAKAKVSPSVLGE
jgi:nucleoid DNA-binding protein